MTTAKSTAAAALGRMGKGIPKKLNAAERERRRKALAEARAKRWPKK